MDRAIRVMWAWSVLGLCAATSQSASPGPLAIEALDGKFRVTVEGQLFAEVDYRTYAKPIVYPIHGPGQIGMTRNYPMRDDVSGEAHDHPHHKSMWFAHGDINGVSFWDERGKIVNDEVLNVDDDPQQPSVTLANKLLDGDGNLVCRETVKITFRVLPGARVIDWDETLHAGDKELRIGDTKEGTMGLRVHPNLQLENDRRQGVTTAQGTAVNSEGVRARMFGASVPGGSTIRARSMAGRSGSRSSTIRRTCGIRPTGTPARTGCLPPIRSDCPPLSAPTATARTPSLPGNRCVCSIALCFTRAMPSRLRLNNSTRRTPHPEPPPDSAAILPDRPSTAGTWAVIFLGWMPRRDLLDFVPSCIYLPTLAIGSCDVDVSSLTLLAQDPTPLNLGVRLPFSILHFLEFAIWGAWYVVLGNYLDSLKFSRKDIGSIYSTVWIGSIIAPMFVGSIADRFVNTEIVLAVSHLVGAALLYWMAQIRQPKPFFWVALLYALAYAPTLGLVNSIVFAHVSVDHFPSIRVLGSIGWIVVGLSLKLFLRPGESVNNRPLLLAAALSAVLGVYCFFLPTTKPPQQGASAFPFLDAMELLKDPSFAAFFGVSFLISLALSVYFSFTALFLEQDSKISPDNIGPVMSIGQWFEVLVMWRLQWFLDFLGMKWVLAAGALAWGLRDLLFAIGKPLALVIVGIALHGICYNFFFTAGAMYVEQAAPKAISASAQSLLVLVTYGLGMTIGAIASGWLNEKLTREVTDPQTPSVVTRLTDWRRFWLVPCAVVLVSFVLLVLFVRVPQPD